MLYDSDRPLPPEYVLAEWKLPNAAESVPEGCYALLVHADGYTGAQLGPGAALESDDPSDSLLLYFAEPFRLASIRWAYVSRDNVSLDDLFTIWLKVSDNLAVADHVRLLGGPFKVRHLTEWLSRALYVTSVQVRSNSESLREKYSEATEEVRGTAQSLLLVRAKTLGFEILGDVGFVQPESPDEADLEVTPPDLSFDTRFPVADRPARSLWGLPLLRYHNRAVSAAALLAFVGVLAGLLLTAEAGAVRILTGFIGVGLGAALAWLTFAVRRKAEQRYAAATGDYVLRLVGPQLADKAAGQDEDQPLVRIEQARLRLFGWLHEWLGEQYVSAAGVADELGRQIHRAERTWPARAPGFEDLRNHFGRDRVRALKLLADTMRFKRVQQAALREWCAHEMLHALTCLVAISQGKNLSQIDAAARTRAEDEWQKYFTNLIEDMTATVCQPRWWQISGSGFGVIGELLGYLFYSVRNALIMTRKGTRQTRSTQSEGRSDFLHDIRNQVILWIHDEQRHPWATRVNLVRLLVMIAAGLLVFGTVRFDLMHRLAPSPARLVAQRCDSDGRSCLVFLDKWPLCLYVSVLPCATAQRPVTPTNEPPQWPPTPIPTTRPTVVSLMPSRAPEPSQLPSVAVSPVGGQAGVTPVGQAQTAVPATNAGGDSGARTLPPASLGGIVGYYGNLPSAGLITSESLSSALGPVRLDRSLNFRWPDDLPAGLSANGPVGVRWLGYIYTDRAGSAQFNAAGQGGLRLWVNGYAVIDRWVGGALNQSGSYTFPAAGLYPVRLDYFRTPDDRQFSLNWQLSGAERRSLSGSDLGAAIGSDSLPTWTGALGDVRRESWNKSQSACAYGGAADHWERIAFDLYLADLRTAPLSTGWEMRLRAGGADLVPCLVTGADNYLVPGVWNVGSTLTVPGTAAVIRTFAVFVPAGMQVESVTLRPLNDGVPQSWRLNSSGREAVLQGKR